MNNLTTKELLFLEDMSKLFESIAKNCDSAASSATDTQFRAYMQSMSQEHNQWITSTAAIVNNSNLQ